MKNEETRPTNESRGEKRKRRDSLGSETPPQPHMPTRCAERQREQSHVCVGLAKRTPKGLSKQIHSRSHEFKTKPAPQKHATYTSKQGPRTNSLARTHAESNISLTPSSSPFPRTPPAQNGVGFLHEVHVRLRHLPDDHSFAVQLVGGERLRRGNTNKGKRVSENSRLYYNYEYDGGDT